MFPPQERISDRDAGKKVRNDFLAFTTYIILVELGVFCSATLSQMDQGTTDPAVAKFIQQIQAEAQKAKFAEQVQMLNDRCFDICFPDSRLSSKMDGKSQTCLTNCVNRMIDTQELMVQHLSKLQS